jgi:hypothetical protein
VRAKGHFKKLRFLSIQKSKISKPCAYSISLGDGIGAGAGLSKSKAYQKKLRFF